MKKIYSLLLAALLGNTIANAQTTAMDFTMNDCNSVMHNLYSELDPGNVIIMEFFHTCPSCAAAANDLKAMYQDLTATYGTTKVRFYVTPYDDGYNCTSVLNWVNTNGLSSVVVPFDSGGVQTAYYGGMGMPTIVVAAGSTHKLLYLCNQTVPFYTSDTTLIGTAIRNFLDSTYAGVSNIQSNVSISIFPNPTTDELTISIEAKEAGMLKLELANITGDKVAGLTEEKIQTGVWKKNFPISLSNGIYFIKGSLNEKPFQEKVTVLH